MKIEDELTVRAGRDAVFRSVRDARFFTSCLEGVSELTEIDPSHYTALIETRLSFLRLKFKVAVELVRVEAPCEIEAKIEGTPLGILGRLTAVSVTALTEMNGETHVRYTIDAALTGKLGSLGQAAFSAKAKEMSRRFGANLRAALETGACEAMP
jgi:carbon monoxide dehydrogenase subunit G